MPKKEEKTARLSEEIRSVIALAVRADFAAGRKQEGTVHVDNPECIAYPCQCSNGTYCCVCPVDVCESFCQSGCGDFNYYTCLNEAGGPCGCVTNSDCP